MKEAESSLRWHNLLNSSLSGSHVLFNRKTLDEDHDTGSIFNENLLHLGDLPQTLIINEVSWRYHTGAVSRDGTTVYSIYYTYEGGAKMKLIAFDISNIEDGLVTQLSDRDLSREYSFTVDLFLMPHERSFLLSGSDFGIVEIPF